MTNSYRPRSSSNDPVKRILLEPRASWTSMNRPIFQAKKICMLGRFVTKMRDRFHFGCVALIKKRTSGKMALVPNYCTLGYHASKHSPPFSKPQTNDRNVAAPGRARSLVAAWRRLRNMPWRNSKQRNELNWRWCIQMLFCWMMNFSNIFFLEIKIRSLDMKRHRITFLVFFSWYCPLVRLGAELHLAKCH